ncbi:hypothetical protein KFE96_13630 [Kordiimonas sp. SCSIO 12603]|uniref:acyl-homoserine-lactone synthase n=1 Tax=Kordiimonas sp. SCSIO 12603 TaxID=2829596 RepID=UPI002101F106|nr:acyl-homoserine-lactone synthase [Kordiimonas sp. SCSIO 12603]UTW57859.1 hypothetical protein KFE96_13630 [Kordiimonas sp. SCSIO 12603]
MIKIIPFEKQHEYKELFDHMYCMRHKLYVEGRKIRHWGSADGREKDAYDAEGTIYLVALGPDGELEAGLRLVPTEKPHLLKNEYEAFCSVEEAPAQSDAWEMSRVFVSSNSRYNKDGIPLKGLLFCAMVSYARSKGINYITGINDSFFLPRVLECGIKVVPLGLPKRTEWGELIAYKMFLDDTSLHKSLNYYHVPKGAMEIVDANRLHDEAEPYLVDETDIAFSQLIGRRTPHIKRMAEIMPRLGSSNPDEVAIAELELDKLISDVRAHIVANSQFSGGSSHLN